MQVTETVSQGLRREFKVTIEAEEIAKRVDKEIESLKNKVRLKGFRLGKAPTSQLKRLYGRSVMADALQNAVNDANKTIIEERGLKLATPPKIKLPEDKDEIAAVMKGNGSLTYEIAIEVLPSFDIVDFSDLELIREIAEPSQEEIDNELRRLLTQEKP